jgi:hypothetical protein
VDRPRTVAALVAALALGACGTGGAGSNHGVSAGAGRTTATTATAPSEAAPATTAAGPAHPAASALPDVEVDDLTAGSRVDLARLVPAGQPVLLWLWAPH